MYKLGILHPTSPLPAKPPLTSFLLSQTCRQRKLKCDEQKPNCGQCAKGARDCVPSDGVIFRHQQNASMNGTEESSANEKITGRLGSFYAYKNTFDENNVWVDVPKNGRQEER